MNLFTFPFELLKTLRADRLLPLVQEPNWDAFLAFATAPQRDPVEDLCRAVLEIAVEEVGHGEEGGNNIGPDIARYVAPAKPPQNWCAGYVGWCYQEAAEKSRVPLPFRRSLGAKRLGANIGAVGRVFQDPTEARPGDVMIFDRGPTGSWLGHIALIEKVDVLSARRTIHTLEGNAGPKVMRRKRYVDQDRFANFATLRR